MRLGFGLQLLGDEPVEQRHVLQPAAIVVLEEIAHHGAAGLLVRIKPNELGAPIGCPHGVLREHPADLVGLIELELLTLSQTCSWRAWSATTEKAMSCSSVMSSAA